MLSRIIIILSISSLFPAICSAAIYKWEDAEGKVHYSETRPAKHQSKKMKVPTRAPENTSTYKRPSIKTDKEDDSKDNSKSKGKGKGKDGDKQQADKGMSDEEKASQCERARNAITRLNSRGRFRQQDKDGNVSYMTDEEKQKRIEREQERVNRFCQ